MRFPNQPGFIAGLSLQVTSLERSTQFWRTILRLKRASYLAVGSGIDLEMDLKGLRFKLLAGSTDKR